VERKKANAKVKAKLEAKAKVKAKAKLELNAEVEKKSNWSQIITSQSRKSNSSQSGRTLASFSFENYGYLDSILWS
jgi:hypothetical protein